MRTPEHKIAQPRAGRQFQEELQLRYLSPGAFTVLPPDDPPPDPPAAREPYRLTPSTRRHRNQAFAVIGEAGSRPGSRSPSPGGRVSPFRGRGFNPTGSRFVSPNPSPPPPEDARLSPTKASPRKTSKIPQLKRKGSTSAFGERVYHYDPSPTPNRLNTKLSQSLTNLDTNNVASRPPPSPRKNVNINKTPAFQRLSPITGSSPEPSQSLSSPSGLPKSRSTPPSRRNSPIRTPSSAANKPPPSKRSSRAVSRSESRTQSRSQSRSESPTKVPPTPTKIPLSKYKNVQAKVNTFNKSKPKVPPKPQVLSEQSEESDATKDIKTKPSLTKKESVNKLRTISKARLITRTGNDSNSINNNNATITTTTITTTTTSTTLTTSDSSSSIVSKINNNKNDTKLSNGSGVNNKSNNANNGTVNKTANDRIEGKKDSPQKVNNVNNNNIHESVNGKTKNNRSSNSSPVKESVQKPTRVIELPTDIDTSYDIKETTDSGTDDYLSKKSYGSPVKLSDILPSTTTVVSSTTSTVTQPLKIDANLNISKQLETPKTISPMVDGRVLSATSVSNAINRMNDTVLNTQTVLRDHGLTKLSPAANAVISVANESSRVTNPALDTKHATTALPKVEPVSIRPEPIAPDVTSNSNTNRINNNTNHITHAGVISAKDLETEVQKHMNKLISPEHNTGNSVQKSINDRIKEARTVVAADVKPIRITVKEKPSDVEVQSGNVRVPVGVSNGLNERPRPGLPPADQTPPNEPEKEAPPKNVCARFLSNCKSKIPCQCCKKDQEHHEEEQQPKQQTGTGCFSCLGKKKEEQVRINIEDEQTDVKPKLWDKLKCCNKHKVRDSSCFPSGKRKDSWVERRESVPSDQSQQPTASRTRCSKDCCKDFLRKIFCINLCCKRKLKEGTVSRKASVISKKKSLTPTPVPPPEDDKSKIDMSLVEFASPTKAAIPVLPLCLAWFCLVMNCIIPGIGTILSGLFCLCLGKPRFSQKDGPKQRIGSFLINTIIGLSQTFTVLFCLVGWGWSIWWGIIMLKVARKHKKLKHLEAIEEAGSRPSPAENQNHHSRDPERNA